jgi:hypothetical protein
VWMIPQHNQFQSEFDPLRFVSLAVIFHGDQFRPW